MHIHILPLVHDDLLHVISGFNANVKGFKTDSSVLPLPGFQPVSWLAVFFVCLFLLLLFRQRGMVQLWLSWKEESGKRIEDMGKNWGFTILHSKTQISLWAPLPYHKVGQNQIYSVLPTTVIQHSPAFNDTSVWGEQKGMVTLCPGWTP